MRSKEYNTILRNMLILSWVFLLVTFALEIFGIATFEVNIKSERIQNLIYFIETNIYSRIFLNMVFSLFTLNLMFASVIKYYFKSFYVVNLIIVFYLLHNNFQLYFNETNFLFFFFSIAIYFVPLILKQSWLSVIVIFIYDNAFALIIATMQGLSIFKYEADFINLIFTYTELMLLWLITLITVKMHRSTLCGFLEYTLAFSQKELKNLKRNALDTLNCFKIVAKTKKNIFQNVYQCARKKLKNLKLYAKFDLIDDIKNEILPLVIIFGVYFAFAYFSDKMLQAIFLYLSYIILRKHFPKHFHADFIPKIKDELIEITCIVLTSFVLCLALYNTIGGGLSVISSVIVAFCADWLLYVIRDYFDRQVCRISTEEINDYFTLHGTLEKYHDYLTETICNGMRDTDYFKLERNRGKNIDEQQYRNEKSKFRNKVIKNVAKNKKFI